MAKSVGEQIKQARLERGLTLEQVSQATRIRKHYLEAIENDQRNVLPSPVQGRGFLRLFAGHLNLPVAPLLAAWDGKVPVEPPSPENTVILSTNQTAPEDPARTEAEDDPALPIFVSASPVEKYPPAGDGSQPGGSQEIFREIGQKLRQQREALGLSRAEVERYTHLRQHYIQALEEGNQANLPSPVQGRGMLSNYAAFLNMSEDELLLRYADALQVRRIERIPKPDPQSLFPNKKRPAARQAPFWRRFLTPDLVFGVGLAAVILFFVLWTASRINVLRSEESEPTPPAISEILLNPPAQLTETVETDPNEGSDQNELATEVLAGQIGGLPVNSEAVVFTETPAPASVGPINNDPLQVYIIARQRAWLRVTTDDTVKFLGRVVPGNAYAFSAGKQIELATGNAAAIQVFYNQTELGTLGITGEVVELIFSQDGIMTPTPAFTPTSAPTKIASITPTSTEAPQATPTVTPFIP
jgi:cytoskeleton protein RodZ